MAWMQAPLLASVDGLSSTVALEQSMLQSAPAVGFKQVRKGFPLCVPSYAHHLGWLTLQER